jgi:hypothetical protein
MPSEMFERGKRDAEADALDENYYHYYYDYRLAYDEVVRNRRRSRRSLMLRRFGRTLAWALPVLLLVAGAAFTGYRYLVPPEDDAALAEPTTTPTPRPTLVPPTPRPDPTPTLELALRADAFAVITGTNGAPLRVRAEPGTDTGVVTRFAEGRVVRIVEGPQEVDGYRWWRVELDGQSGWSADAFLQPVEAPGQP